jgi:hypothetical protein
MPMNENEKRKDEMTCMRTGKPNLIYKFLWRELKKIMSFHG